MVMCIDPFHAVSSTRSRARSRAQDAAGVFCCGLRVVSMDGSITDVPDTPGLTTSSSPGRANATRAHPGRGVRAGWLAAAESGTGTLIGSTFGLHGREQTVARDLLAAFHPGMLVLADRKLPVPHPGPRRAGHRGAPAVAGLGLIRVVPDQGASRWHVLCTWPG